MADSLKEKQEIQLLLTQSAAVEASQVVWKKLQAALDGLSPTGRAVLSRHFDGESVSEIAESENLTTLETSELLRNLKQQLIRNLGSTSRCRN
jgi:DNA-directed RNA polymerase specialized sigma24 family protein